MNDSLPQTPEWSKSLSRELEEVINRQNMLTTRTRRRVLTSLQETSKSEEDEEMKKLRKKAIDEIINSEKSYLCHLEIVEEYFMKPIQESKILPGQVFAGIFGDILGIRQVNKELLTAMEISTEEIGKVFLELAPYLKFYSTYANDFEKATKLVEEWTEKHKGFRTLLANQESRPEVQKKLNALLITPVQRVPRYKLLLDDVIKNTPRFHPDKNNLEEARTQIDAIAWYINDQIKEHENNLLMVSIQKSLQGGLPKIIKPGRKLLRHGNLMKMSKSGGHAQPRYVVLFSDMLMYCKFRGHAITGTSTLDLPKQDALEVCCVLPLKQTKVEHVMGKGVFTVVCGKENLILYSTNAQDTDWVEDIKKATTQLKKNSASLKRASSKFEPMRKPDILKLRRESLSKIMLSRKTEDSKREQLKESTNTRSPLTAVLSPRKRKPDLRIESPMKLKRIVETSPAVAVGASPSVGRSTPTTRSSSRLNQAATKPSSTPTTPSSTPSRRKKENAPLPPSTPRLGERPKSAASNSAKDNMDESDGHVVMRKKVTIMPVSSPSSSKSSAGARTEFRRQPRNSLRSLSLHRATTNKLKTEGAAARPKTIFRSPSIYDEPPQIDEDAMTSYLSGRIVPLSPSTRPTNVEHLVKKDKENEEATEATETHHPVALIEKKSYCNIS